MEGERIYKKLSKRDHTGSNSDKYAQLLQTIFLHLSGNNEIKMFYELLDRAQKQNKLLSIDDPDNVKDEYCFSDLIITDNFN
ncbi:hypothetical protein DRF62_18660 [Chryseobacterium piscium]|uniref:Uncharacterized protein n=1 Tax=Chryseobacterium piscium TaxID=333702 RepID=A0A3D9BBV8_9FLAO|nr:hypothetical protein [Chryseobacterium piscium]REC50816.1 hypothetical protein DRF62_18660 [Chryseobacterium piscium]